MSNYVNFQVTNYYVVLYWNELPYYLCGKGNTIFSPIELTVSFWARIEWFRGPHRVFPSNSTFNLFVVFFAVSGYNGGSLRKYDRGDKTKAITSLKLCSFLSDCLFTLIFHTASVYTRLRPGDFSVSLTGLYCALYR